MKNDVSKKKTSKEKRVLIAALCIAAAVTAGSTFAWFNSSDEVTNRLSAKGEYNTSIAETFTPPEDIVPGQEINLAAHELVGELFHIEITSHLREGEHGVKIVEKRIFEISTHEALLD